MIGGVCIFASKAETPTTWRSPTTIGDLDHEQDATIHPGEIVREEFLVPLELSASALALELKVPALRINDIVRGRRSVTPDTALRLSRYFGTSPEFWMDLQTAFDLKSVTKDSGEKIEAEISPRAA